MTKQEQIRELRKREAKLVTRAQKTDALEDWGRAIDAGQAVAEAAGNGSKLKLVSEAREATRAAAEFVDDGGPGRHALVAINAVVRGEEYYVAITGDRERDAVTVDVQALGKFGRGPTRHLARASIDPHLGAQIATLLDTVILGALKAGA